MLEIAARRVEAAKKHMSQIQLYNIYQLLELMADTKKKNTVLKKAIEYFTEQLEAQVATFQVHIQVN